MKNSFLCILLSICFLSTNAQDIKNTEKIPSSYDRSAITLFFLDFPGENHSGEIKNKIDQISFSEKYYNNNFSNLTIPAPFNRGQLNENLVGQIMQYLQNKKNSQ